MPFNFEPQPKVDPLLRIRKSDTPENLRQKGDTLGDYHDDEIAREQYHLAANQIETRGCKNYGEWEAKVLAAVGSSREQELAGLREEFGPDWDDPYMEWEDPMDE